MSHDLITALMGGFVGFVLGGLFVISWMVVHQ